MTSEEQDTLAATVYAKRGGMLTLRTALDDNDPMSWPSLWRDKFGEDMPMDKREELGLYPPKRCPTCDQLLPEGGDSW